MSAISCIVIGEMHSTTVNEFCVPRGNVIQIAVLFLLANVLIPARKNKISPHPIDYINLALSPTNAQDDLG